MHINALDDVTPCCGAPRHAVRTTPLWEIRTSKCCDAPAYPEDDPDDGYICAECGEECDIEDGEDG